MPAIPEITTERLVLRPFRAADGAALQRLAGAREVAATTLRIPHPYPDGAAEAWIATHADLAEQGAAIMLAVTERESGALAGGIGLDLAPDHAHAELGYWTAVRAWGRGYATEAAIALVRWAFGALDLHRIHAHHFMGNLASGRVLEKAGFRCEGLLREHVRKWDEFHDIVLWGILRAEA